MELIKKTAKWGLEMIKKVLSKSNKTDSTKMVTENGHNIVQNGENNTMNNYYLNEDQKKK